MMSERTGAAVCDYCESPLPSPWWGGETANVPDRGPKFCCLGCRMASSIVQERGETGATRGILIRLGLAIFFTMHVMAFTMALWTTDVYEAADPSNRLLMTMHGLFRHLVLLFSVPVLVLLGLPLFKAGWDGVRRGILSTDALLGTGVAAAFAFSAISVIRGAGGVYFEVGCVILVMTTLGRWLEATGRLKATSALDALARLLPESVRRIAITDDGQFHEEFVPLEAIARGDRLRILPGERFPADGLLLEGAALVDEQVLTGESRPVLKEVESAILGGTLNLDGDLVISVGAVGGEGTLARLVDMVRQARLSKGKYQQLVDRISAWFFPVVATVAMLAFSFHAWTSSLEQGILAGLAVSLIACPCALGLATPLAVWSALGIAANHQVLFRSGESLERLAEVTAIRFDKTGTLTTGTAIVRDETYENERDCPLGLAHATALASRAPHALSRAVVERAECRDVRPTAMEDVRVIPGRGVVGVTRVGRTAISIGSPLLMDEQGLLVGPRLRPCLEQAHADGLPMALVGWDGLVRVIFVFSETWRPGVSDVFASLRDLGLDVEVLTGDHIGRGRAISKELGVPVVAGLLPHQKVEAVDRAGHGIGTGNRTVAMVGDGVNDAPALAASHIGVALGCGTDVSRDSAGICLLGDDLTRIPWALDLARRTVSVVRGNLFWAFAYNTGGVLIAALGWLNPAVASALMVASGAVVIVRSLGLRTDSSNPDGPPFMDLRTESVAGRMIRAPQPNR